MLTPGIDWWEKNKSKSQEEWIADGFAQRGVTIDMPPTSKQTSVLLTLLGNSETNEAAAVPRHVKYNAFRCLRDSGFDPVEFALSLSHRTISGDIEKGLLEYAKWYRRYPEVSGVGILAFGKNDANKHGPVAEIVTPEFQAKANARVFVPLAIGTALLLWSFRRRKS